MEERIEELVAQRVEEELSALLDHLEARLPADVYRRVMILASRMDEQGDDEYPG